MIVCALYTGIQARARNTQENLKKIMASHYMDAIIHGKHDKKEVTIYENY